MALHPQHIDFYEVDQSVKILTRLILPVNKAAPGAFAAGQAYWQMCAGGGWGRAGSERDGFIINVILQQRVRFCLAAVSFSQSWD